MKFLAIMCLMISMSAFSEGENGGATENQVTNTCDHAIENSVTNLPKGEGDGVDDKSGGDGSTEQ
jgi:hypothetical protein